MHKPQSRYSLSERVVMSLASGSSETGSTNLFLWACYTGSSIQTREGTFKIDNFCILALPFYIWEVFKDSGGISLASH